MKSWILLIGLSSSGCLGAAPEVDASSFPERPPEQAVLSGDRRAELEADLASARADLARDPESESAAIWVGRRLGYLGRYQAAVDQFSGALAQHPDSFRLLRHRGHRYITLRDFPAAVEDLTRAALLAEHVPDAIEPDGAPNPSGIPTSSTWFNIQYHLGLAHFLLADFDAASTAFQRSLESPLTNDDKLVAATHWRWLALMRLGRTEEAGPALEAVPQSLVILENHSYSRLIELYRLAATAVGPEAPDLESDPSSAAYAYGLAAWRQLRGDAAGGRELLNEIVEKTNRAAFGHIAAEVDLQR